MKRFKDSMTEKLNTPIAKGNRVRNCKGKGASLLQWQPSLLGKKSYHVSVLPHWTQEPNTKLIYLQMTM